jgi:hypothetical protein
VADDQRWYLGCDVPIDTTATGFDQLRVYYHVDLAGGIRHERIHVSGTPTRAFASYRLAHVVPLGGGPPAVISEAQIYRLGRGASTMITHRQFEAVLDLAESGLHLGVPFAAYVEVETDPHTDASGRVQHRVLAGTLGSQAVPVWFELEPRQAR